MFVLSTKDVIFHKSGNLDLMNGEQNPPQHNISTRIFKKNVRAVQQKCLSVVKRFI